MFYIGSTARLSDRLKTHRWNLKANIHHNAKLQRHYNKYGKQDLFFVILEKFEFLGKDHLLQKEQSYLDGLHPTFNIAHKVQSCLGVKRRAETKRKISKALTGVVRSPETIEKMRAASTGRPCKFKGVRGTRFSEEALSKMRRKFSDEHRRRLSESHKGYKPSPETRQKRSDSLKRFYRLKKQAA